MPIAPEAKSSKSGRLHAQTPATATTPALAALAVSLDPRLIKIALVGLTTCGLGWVWQAMYLYYERFKQRRLPASGERRR